MTSLPNNPENRVTELRNRAACEPTQPHAKQPGDAVSRLDAIRARGLTAWQLGLLAQQTGDSLVAAEADAQAVRERVLRGPHRPTATEASASQQQATNVLRSAFPRGASSAWVTR